MTTAAYTFGVLDKIEIAETHVVSIEGGDPLAALPESSVTAWAAGTFAIGDQRSHAATHGIYTCIKAHTTAGGLTPDQDAENWKLYGTTMRWRLFDLYRSTKTVAPNKLRVVLRPRAMVDTIDLQGLRGSTITVTVTDGPGGAVLLNETRALDMDSVTDWDEYFFGVALIADSAFFASVPVSADPVITIDLAFPGDQCEIGALQIGRFVEMGWTEYDADVGVVSYSYLSTAADGTVTWKKRPGAGDMNVKVWVEPKDANAVAFLIDKYDGVPTLWVAHTDDEFRPLRKTGFFVGRLSYPNFGQRSLSGSVKSVI